MILHAKSHVGAPDQLPRAHPVRLYTGNWLRALSINNFPQNEGVTFTLKFWEFRQLKAVSKPYSRCCIIWDLCSRSLESGCVHWRVSNYGSPPFGHMNSVLEELNHLCINENASEIKIFCCPLYWCPAIFFFFFLPQCNLLDLNNDIVIWIHDMLVVGQGTLEVKIWAIAKKSFF